MSRPIKTGGYSNYGRHAARDRKRQEAEARNEAWRALPPFQQFVELNKRPGESKKQKARIRKALKEVA